VLGVDERDATVFIREQRRLTVAAGRTAYSAP
jgi:hypothetical protein